MPQKLNISYVILNVEEQVFITRLKGFVIQ